MSVRVTIVMVERQYILHILNVCVCVCVCVALVIQHAKRMRVIFGLVRLYKMFPHYLMNGTIFGGGVSLNIKCVS